jgi:integrase/recombinase XerD
VPATVTVLRAWLAERQGSASEPLFPTSTGRRLSRDAIEHRVALCVSRAGGSCPSLRSKHVTTHTLRHTAAMRLLLSGVDVVVIALWLGHEQVSTTNVYLHADMGQKERAIARVNPPTTKPGRFAPLTRSWLSSRPCDYGDEFRPFTPAGQEVLEEVGITKRSA